MIEKPLNPTTSLLPNGGGVLVSWDDTPNNEHGYEVWASVNGGAYALLTTTLPNVTSYIDVRSGGTINMKYKIRAKGADQVSGFSSIVSADQLEFIFTSTGNGSGLGGFGIQVSESVYMSIDGNGEFFSDLAGTISQGQSKLITTGALRTTYIKVTSGVATLRIKNVITKWGDNYTGSGPTTDGWNTTLDGNYTINNNCPSLSTDVSLMTHNTCINVFGLNTLYGDLTGHAQLTYMEIADGTNEHTQAIRGATVTGDVSTMPILDTLDVWDLTTFYGEIPVSIKVLWIGGLNSCTISNLALMVNLVTGIVYATSTVTIAGSIAGLTALQTWQMFEATSESGSIAALINLSTFNTFSANITVPNVTNLTKLSYLFTPGIVLTSANVNQILADFWANRNAAKPTILRTINLQAATGTGSPTGQGLLDKAALEAYSSPTPPGTAALWTVLTR